MATGVLAFVVVTVVLGGLAAVATGRAVALTWSPLWHLLFYVLLLAVGVRLLEFALFGGTQAPLAAGALDLLILAPIAFLAHRLVRAGQMAGQYPWLFTRAGPFSWRTRCTHSASGDSTREERT